MGGVFWQLGALMNKKINENYQVNIGLTYTGKQSIRAKRDQEWGSFVGTLTTPDYSYKVDSISSKKGKIILPANLGAGILFKNGDYWQVGVDYCSVVGGSRYDSARRWRAITVDINGS